MKEDVTYRTIMPDVCPRNMLDIRAGYIKDGIFYPSGTVSKHFYKLHKNNQKNVKEKQYVYFIDGGELLKIGTAKNVSERLRNLQVGSPVKLRLIKKIDGGRKEEKKIHKIFSDLKTHGEWFVKTPALLDYIERL